jgi:hypothetical protein
MITYTTSTTTDPVCLYCGRPIVGPMVWGSGPYHPECVQSPNLESKELQSLREDNLRLAAIAAVPCYERERIVEEANSSLKSKLHEALSEIRRLRSMSHVEMMSENRNVYDHTVEWENRCLKAESERDEVLGKTEHQWLLKVAIRLVQAGCKSCGIVDSLDEVIKDRDDVRKNLQDERTLSDHLASALVGDYPEKIAMDEYCEGLKSDYYKQKMKAKMKRKQQND